MFLSSQQAKPITQSLFQRLSALALRVDRDEVTIAALKRDAAKLRKADIVDAEMVLGAIAALEWDVDGIREHYEKALSLSHGDPSVLHNYGVSLDVVCLVGEAAQKIKEAFEAEREDLYLLRIALRMCMRAGQLSDARKLLGTARKQGLVLEENDDLSLLNACVSVFEQAQVTEEAAVAASKCVFDLFHQENVVLTEETFSVFRDNVTHFLYVDAPTDVAANLNERIAACMTANEALLPVARVYSAICIGRETEQCQ